MDTVQLEGKHFKAHVTHGEFVEKGQLLIEFDIEAIEQSGRALTTPVIVTNRKALSPNNANNVQTGDSIFNI